jgi:hypothetical protein
MEQSEKNCSVGFINLRKIHRGLSIEKNIKRICSVDIRDILLFSSYNWANNVCFKVPNTS